jgi:5'-deoxynucleotidase YfbR-like HD superfamily hydrolase
MKRIFELVQNLQNLNRIKRTGGNLALGLPSEMNLSIAEHSYTVAYLSTLFVDILHDEKVSFDKVVRFALTHDWKEIIIGDIPAGSPSYSSFWSISIREEAKKAGEKAIEEMLDSIKEEIDISQYKSNLTDKEKQIIKAADWTAYLLEMQEWKYLGYQHEGWEMIWFNTLKVIEEIDLPFIPELLTQIKESYKRGSKRPSPWLAKVSKQVNPEHSL